MAETVTIYREPTVAEEQQAIGDELMQKRLTATGHDAKPVPIGGQHYDRVPESMKENAPADWRQLPVAQVEVLPEYGEQHDNLVQLRKDLEQVKRVIDSLGPSCEARMRLREKLEKEETAEEEKTMLMMQIEEATRKRDAAFDSINLMVGKIEDSDATTDDTTKSRMQALAIELRSRGTQDFKNKEEFHVFWSFCRQTNQKIFGEQKKLLERIKVIKREKTAAIKETKATDAPLNEVKPKDVAA
eukprot:gnl/TRDRNA2_/TRDRNA2_178386_c0_seq1.p1 gnl/TRDRNA2_/TRDRNA2_178386_c0~~gnl/TRDRNA2_/TRDRNA2_178386_c0_seq1.p1  ORF type:complete len:281 (-),score=80.40 gnl/TRDRNA2_/TRDRNA2_178386_c0_seq1:180-911(-)